MNKKFTEDAPAGDAISQYRSGDLIIRITHDEDPTDPRGWDNLGTMICRHPDYTLGDTAEADGLEDAEYQLPLYLYDHSGITMATHDNFPDRMWDVSHVGFIVVTEEKLREEGLGDRPREEILEMLRNEVKTYDQYLRGDVYRFEIVETAKCSLGEVHETHVDSCAGYYSEEECLEAALECV